MAPTNNTGIAPPGNDATTAPLRLDNRPETEAPATGSSIVLRLWRRIPLPVRAILSGLVVFSVLQNGWFSLFVVNSQVLPTVPWSVPLGLIWLWVFFRYFNGRWWPASTSAARREAMRAGRVSGRQWGWSAAFFLVLLTFLIAVINVVYRFVVIPQDNYDLSMLPWWSLYPCLIMLSINAGVSEEAGFRGYMQRGLERSLGPVVAIGVTSLMFWLAHLNHVSGSARFALLLAMAAGLGALTYCVGSIWPAIITHAALDTIFFVTDAAGVAPWFMQQPPQLAETGVDGPFVFFSVLLVVSGVAGAVVLRKLTAAGVADSSRFSHGV